MKLFGSKKKKEKKAPEEKPVNYLRRAILGFATAALWPVLIIALLIHGGALTETLVMSVIIPIIFAMNAVKDLRIYKEQRAEKKKLKEEQKDKKEEDA